MGKAKRAHQFHEAGQWQNFEDGIQSSFKARPAPPRRDKALEDYAYAKPLE